MTLHQHKLVYVQNQDMYVQNQDIAPFFQNYWHDLRYIRNDQHQQRKICFIIDRNVSYSSLFKCSYISF